MTDGQEGGAERICIVYFIKGIAIIETREYRDTGCIEVIGTRYTWYTLLRTYAWERYYEITYAWQRYGTYAWQRYGICHVIS